MTIRFCAGLRVVFAASRHSSQQRYTPTTNDDRVIGDVAAPCRIRSTLMFGDPDDLPFYAPELRDDGFLEFGRRSSSRKRR